jgi:hypothetical protein
MDTVIIGCAKDGRRRKPAETNHNRLHWGEGRRGGKGGKGGRGVGGFAPAFDPGLKAARCGLRRLNDAIHVLTS